MGHPTVIGGTEPDEGTVQRLLELGGEPFFRDLVADFITSSDQSSDAIRSVLDARPTSPDTRVHTNGSAAADGGDFTSEMFDTVTAAAHSLKSSSATLGVLGLSARCREMEWAGIQRDQVRLRAAFAGFLPALERAQRALRGRASVECARPPDT